MRVIDMHTHIFPERGARRIAAAVAERYGLVEEPPFEGTAHELSWAMEKAGVDYALVCFAAATPYQVRHINRFIREESLRRPECIPCGTLHAAFRGWREELAWMRENGIYGVKLHGELQGFALDDERLFPMFREMEGHDMFLLAHMGDPGQLLAIAEAFPNLRCIAAHLGCWGDWDVEKIRLLTKLPNVYTDISSTFSCGGDASALMEILGEFDPGRIFFGSDYPLFSPERELERLGNLGLSEGVLEDICFNNFSRFYHYQKL